MGFRYDLSYFSNNPIISYNKPFTNRPPTATSQKQVHTEGRLTLPLGYIYSRECICTGRTPSLFVNVGHFGPTRKVGLDRQALESADRYQCVFERNNVPFFDNKSKSPCHSNAMKKVVMSIWIENFVLYQLA